MCESFLAACFKFQPGELFFFYFIFLYCTSSALISCQVSTQLSNKDKTCSPPKKKFFRNDEHETKQSAVKCSRERKVNSLAVKNPSLRVKCK